jgi:hypothetical protein
LISLQRADYIAVPDKRAARAIDLYHEGMVVPLRSRLFWVSCTVGIIAIGILSRIVHSGLAIFDKYLGDALYAAMVYGILRLLSKAAASAVWAMVVLTAIESFQLTMIPAHMLASEHLTTRICARLMGVEFSFLDLLAYGVGIGCIYLADSCLADSCQPRSNSAVIFSTMEAVPRDSAANVDRRHSA